MINNNHFLPLTVETFKQIFAEYRDTLEYMLRFGTALERSMANMIISVGGGNNGK